MQKIFFIRANKTRYGGAENYLSRLSEALTKKNIEHQVINLISLNSYVDTYFGRYIWSGNLRGNETNTPFSLYIATSSL